MRTFTQLTGSTTPYANPGSFCDLSQNNSTANVALAGILANNEHRYLLQKYFDTDNTYTTVTIGGQSLVTTGVIALGATSATLTTTWTNQTVQQLVVFSNSNQRTVTFTQGSTAISWQTGLTASATTAITTIGVQAYPIPANVSKIRNNTITVGQLVYTPAPVNSLQEWTMLNALPYTSDIPNYFFIYRNQLGVWVVEFWPIPSTSGNIITFNYKARVPDMSYADYAVGTISGATPGSNAITGSSTVWTAFPQNVDLSYNNLMFRITPSDGDGYWYPIQRFTSATTLTLNLPVVAVNELTSAAYTIGQVPLLQEDFQDMLVYGPLRIYYSSIVKDEAKFKLYSALYDEKLKLLEDYASTKSVNVDLGIQPVPANPNLFTFASGS